MVYMRFIEAIMYGEQQGANFTMTKEGKERQKERERESERERQNAYQESEMENEQSKPKKPNVKKLLSIKKKQSPHEHRTK